MSLAHPALDVALANEDAVDLLDRSLNDCDVNIFILFLHNSSISQPSGRMRIELNLSHPSFLNHFCRYFFSSLSTEPNKSMTSHSSLHEAVFTLATTANNSRLGVSFFFIRHPDSTYSSFSSSQTSRIFC